MLETFTYKGSDIASEVKVQFGDTGGVQITDRDLLVWINNGQRDIAAQGFFLERSVQTHLIASQGVYDLSTIFPSGESVLSFASVIANGRKAMFLAYPQFQETLNNRDIQGAEAEVSIYFTQYAGKLHLWPIPNESVVNGLSIDYTVWPADLAQLEDTLRVPDRYRNALVAYVFARALEKDENFEAAERQNQLQNTAVQRESGRETASPNDFYPTMSFDPEEEWI